ncbi:MAG: GNAT family N-acetyltransferase [Actinomycetota bacterium]
MVDLSEVVPLDGTHDLAQFRCGKAELDDWLRRYSLVNQRIGGSRTFVTCEGSTVRGFYSLAVSSIEFAQASPKIQRGLGRYPVSVILIARLAVDERVQGQRVGESLLIDALGRSLAVSEQVGVRAVLVHAMDDDAGRFYERYDFERSPTNPYHLALLVQDIEAALP